MKKIALVLLSVLMCLSLFACVEDTPTDGTQSVTESTQSEESKDEARIVYEGNNVKVSFVKVYEEPSLPGTAYLQLLVENVSDKELMVSLSDASINGYQMTFGTALPIVLQPGNKSQQPFVTNYTLAGINAVSDITNISFKVYLLDNSTLQEVEKTSMISVDIQ